MTNEALSARLCHDRALHSVWSVLMERQRLSKSEDFSSKLQSQRSYLWKYQLYLWLDREYNQMHRRARYAMRLANTIRGKCTEYSA
jgi:hypothetical protein